MEKDQTDQQLNGFKKQLKLKKQRSSTKTGRQGVGRREGLGHATGREFIFEDQNVCRSPR